MAVTVNLQSGPINPGAVTGPFMQAHPGLGGMCSFVGEVRREEGVEALELSHYAPLTLPGMEVLAARAAEKFDLLGLVMLHRVGVMLPGEAIVMVAAAARHRRGAIDAVDFCMDHLKSDSWFWKREKRGGAWHWIEPRTEDHADLARWAV